MELTHRRGGLVSCVSDCTPCNGCDVHGHEQCAVPGGARDPQDERVADQDYQRIKG